MRGPLRRMAIVAGMIVFLFVAVPLASRVAASLSSPTADDSETVTTVALFKAQQQFMACLAPLGVRGEIEFDWAQGLPVYRFFSDTLPADEIVEGHAGAACYDTHVGDLEHRWADRYTGGDVRQQELLSHVRTCLRQRGFDIPVQAQEVELTEAFTAAPLAVGACLDGILAER